MRNKILVSIVVVICIIASVVIPVCALAATNETADTVAKEVLPEESVVTTNSEAYIPSENNIQEIILEDSDYERVESEDIKTLEAEIEKCQEFKNQAHAMAEGARGLGYAEDHPIIKLAQSEWKKAHENVEYYEQKINTLKEKEEAKWAQKMAEYPEATQVWRYMKSLGWNDYVCAGIMGNIMAECAGQTLNLQVTISGNGYYGMCQWNKAYREEVWGADLQGQCDFLRDSIKYEIDTFGYAYKKGFKFDTFLNMTNERDAALAFAKSYERCGSGSYGIRQNNATKAYNYFVN